MKLKEFLSVRAIGFKSINVLTDPAGLDELRRLGARSVPVLSQGDRWTFAQNLSHVARFLGLNEQAGPVLSPDELIQRLTLFMRTAITIVPQMPDRLLPEQVPNRPRSYLALAHHLFRIPESMIEVAAGAVLTNDMLTQKPPPDMHSARAVAEYGQHVLDALTEWWRTQTDRSARSTVQTYYGPQTLHELMERTTWHCGQHVRQWLMLLEMAGITPVMHLDNAALAGLPMPDAVWDG